MEQQAWKWQTAQRRLAQLRLVLLVFMLSFFHALVCESPVLAAQQALVGEGLQVFSLWHKPGKPGTDVKSSGRRKKQKNKNGQRPTTAKTKLTIFIISVSATKLWLLAVGNHAG